MACGSCGQKAGGRPNPNVEYQVTKPDGSKVTVASSAEAQQVIANSKGGSFKPVPVAAKK